MIYCVPLDNIVIRTTERNALADVERIVRKTYKDATRRKSNIIVSGLQESSSADDEQLFTTLCEDQLRYKPRIQPNGLLRLGKLQANAGKHRRLRVRLCSEQSAL